MANREYADLPFVPPAAYGRGRPSPPRVIVIHYTAGSERSTSAEDGAAYDQRRTDGTSTHYFVDCNSVVQCVYTWDRANSAMYNGNRIGIQYELCGTKQTRAQWLDSNSDATLTNAAKQAARDAIKYGIPVKKLSPSEVRNGAKGFCGHADITLAFPEDNGDHMDPGPEFPWDVFLPRVQKFIEGEAQDVNLDDGFTIPNWDKDPTLPAVESTTVAAALGCAQQRSYQALRAAQRVEDKVNGIGAAVKALDAKVSAPTPVTVDAAAVATALAGNPAFLAAIVKAVNDDAASRMKS